MRGLHDAGFPVARIVADDLAGSALGRPLFLMEFVEGAEGADERLVDDATAVSFVQTLRRLHELDGASLGFDLVPSTPGDATRMQIDRWHAIASHAGSQPVPLLDEAAAWLRLHAPSLRRLAVVHGDAGPGNFVHREGMVAAMTDWEFAHLGDPAEDWSFCLTMRGSRTMPREAWLELFREHAGVELTDDQWRYWEAFNLFKGACANRTTLALFSAGVNRSPNMAIIGTALHQFFLRRLVDIIHA